MENYFPLTLDLHKWGDSNAVRPGKCNWTLKILYMQKKNMQYFAPANSRIIKDYISEDNNVRWTYRDTGKIEFSNLSFQELREFIVRSCELIPVILVLFLDFLQTQSHRPHRVIRLRCKWTPNVLRGHVIDCFQPLHQSIPERCCGLRELN